MIYKNNLEGLRGQSSSSNIGHEMDCCWLAAPSAEFRFT